MTHGELVEQVCIGAEYEHYKGKRYQVIDIGLHTELEEFHVIYRSLYDDPKFPIGTLWIRPLKMFLEKVEVMGAQVQRFKKVV
jgi:hypothetical protein